VVRQREQEGSRRGNWSRCQAAKEAGSPCSCTVLGSANRKAAVSRLNAVRKTDRPSDNLYFCVYDFILLTFVVFPQKTTQTARCSAFFSFVTSARGKNPKVTKPASF